MAAGRAQPLFGHGGEVDVVLVLDRHRQGRGEFVEQGRGVPAREVGGVAQAAGVRVEGAGGADDEPVDVVAGEARGLHGAVEGVGDLADDGLGGPPSRGLELERTHRAAGDVGDGGEDALGSDVESGGVRGRRIDLVQLGVGAGSSLGGAGGEDEAGRFEAGEQLGGGRLGEAGELADPCAGQLPVLQEEVQGGAVVHGAQDARGARRTGCSCHVVDTCLSTAQLLSDPRGKSIRRSLLGNFPIGWKGT